jgi:hypothetical protein
VRIFRRTWTAIDDCTNTASCSQTIIFVDTTPPLLVCQPNQTNEWVAGSAPIFGVPTVSDDCDTNVVVTNITVELAATCPNVRIFRRTWTAIDDCTNTATCSQLVVFRDTTPPVIACASNQTNEWQAGSVPVFATPTVSDLCDTNVTVTNVTVELPATCPDVRIFRRTWTAIDDCTNTATCSQLIVFRDTTPPTIVCQANQTNEWVAGATPNFGTPAVSDLCDTNVTVTNITVELAATCPNVRIFRRTWTAIDDCTNTSSCSQLVVFRDTTPPVITCQPDRFLEWTNGSVAVFGAPTATDTCDTNVMVTNITVELPATCPAVRVFRRTWTAIDDCTNTASCSQTITFYDITPPVLVGVPANASYQCLTNVPPPPLVTGTDTCDTNVTVTFSAVTNGMCPTIIVRTWKATDDCTNMASAFQVITVIENPPVITTPPMDVRVCEGSNATFCVAASNACPLTYKWFKDMMLIPGATNSCLTVSNVTAAEVGEYCVMVSSPCYSVAACANLTILTNIDVGFIPVPECIPFGTNFTFCPPITGGDMYSCTWYFKGVALPSYTNCCLVLTNYRPSIAGEYALVVEGPCNTVSNVYTLPPPEIVCFPDACTNSLLCEGGSFTFCSDITTNDVLPGVQLSFQWYKVTNAPMMVGGITNILVGATNVCFTVSNATFADQAFYFVIVSVGEGEDLLEAVRCGGTLQVQSNLVAVPLGNRFVCLGDMVEFCAATNSATPPFIFQWYQNGMALPNETNVCLKLTNVMVGSGGEYCVIVTGPCNTVTNCGRVIIGQGQIGNFVWDDLDGDGCQDAGEPGVGNVKVTLSTCLGGMVAMQNTDASGFYCFTNVQPGDYKVTFTAPPGYGFTTANACMNDNTDSDANPATGMTGCYTLRCGETNKTVDAGLRRLVPCLAVLKEVACLLPGDDCGPFGKTATGYKSGTNLPAFCYSIIISNCGPVTLTNMMVMDDKLGDLTTNYFASKLTPFAPGETLTNLYKVAWTNDTTNTVVVSGVTVGTGISTSAVDRAVAFIDEAGITCLHIVYSPADQDGVLDNRVLLPDDGMSHPVTFAYIVCNTGQADLANVTIDAPTLNALGCADPVPFFLAAGACETNVICTVDLTCPNVPSNSIITVTAAVNTVSNLCGYDIQGRPITVRSQCEAILECRGEPCLDVIKTADRPIAKICEPVVYTYVVTNCGAVTLTNVTVRDDNGTPGYTNDDFVVCTLASLAPSSTASCTYTSIPPITLCTNIAGQEVAIGTLITEILPGGDVKVTLLQHRNVADNTYGANASGYPGAHSFQDWVQNDRARFRFLNNLGNTVLDIEVDYLSASGAFPSGYGTLGVGGGDGKVNIGNAAHVLSARTSLSDNLNQSPAFHGFTVNSPAPEANFPTWEYRSIYMVTISKSAFGASGFNCASVVFTHNSPSKFPSSNQQWPLPCEMCVTNIATARGFFRTNTLTAFDDAVVCLQTNRFAALGDFVWRDDNMNGIQDVGEPGVSNVTVRLQDCLGNTLRTTNTGPSGFYLFGGLLPGSYKVQFVLPANYVFTTQNAGVDDAKDSDADPLTGMADCTVLTAGEVDLTHDAGLIRMAPCIDVVKEIACLLPGDNCSPFGKTAQGYKGSANPAFCYRITIRNCGTVTLTNVSVWDNKLGGSLTTNFFGMGPRTLTNGQVITRMFKKDWAVDTTNQVDVTGKAVSDGSTVSDWDKAVALVDPAAITCSVKIASPDDQDGVPNDGNVRLPQDNNPHSVTFSVMVMNTGQADLANVTIQSPALAALGCAAPAPFNLAAGASVTVNLCTQNLLCTNLPLTVGVSVNGTVDTTTGRCGYDINGNPISVNSVCSGQVECAAGGCLFLVIDEDSIDNGNPPNFFSDIDVNDQMPAIGSRKPLKYFQDHVGQEIYLHTGQVGDEGWFAVKTIPNSWNLAGPTPDGLRNYFGNPALPFPHNVGPGLGTPDGNGDREALLDKIPNVTPLRALGLHMLIGQCICAVVYDSDISINYGPLNGSLKGENLGVVAFEVLKVEKLNGYSSSSLPKVKIRIRDALTSCTTLTRYTNAPVPTSSSTPFDICPPGGNCGSDDDDDDDYAPSASPLATASAPEGETLVPGCQVFSGGKLTAECTYPQVRYATHSGQVGAPAGVMTAFDPDSGCVIGSWQHERQIAGSLKGTFRATGFDSFMDRAAPDKVSFSGMGAYTLSTGARTPQPVLFRVDLDDRGGQPSVVPASFDQYRIRIWVLTAEEVARLGDAADQLLDIRRIIACAETAIPGVVNVPRGSPAFGLRAPDIDDCGEVSTGSHVVEQLTPACR